MSTATTEQQPPTAVDIPTLLKTLNPAQLAGTLFPSRLYAHLIILAGPGSGKTKVLTSRIVYLIKEKAIPPQSICAVTFTNKAANEMRERLTKLIGKEETQALQLGTFHSICAKFLRKQSKLAGLKANFTITDADEGKKIFAGLLKPYSTYLTANDINLNENEVSSKISQAKAKGLSVTQFLARVQKEEEKNPLPPDHDGEAKKTGKRITAEIYEKYEKALKSNNALDFDDLLVYGVKLFKYNRNSVSWCNHILVDEFQDTNAMQYDLMKAIGFRKSITIVGDPDQSIYGWRSAQVTNINDMYNDFAGTRQIFLEQNYRSTSSILKASLAIVSEGKSSKNKSRIAKSLHTTHPSGLKPVLRRCDGEKDEAGYIAYEIKRCAANMGGMLKWGDFAILLRFNALSRPLESALQKQGIPCKILGGHRFFERMEIKDLLSYMHLIDNPSFAPSFSRAVNVPPRGMGDKTLEAIAARAESLNISHLEVVERIHDGRIPDLKPAIKRKVVPFVKVIRTLRQMNEQNTTPADMLRKLLALICYEEHLKKMGQDWESRWENVQELITFAIEVEAEAPAVEPTLESEDSAELEPALRRFLQVSMLETGTENESEDAANGLFSYESPRFNSQNRAVISQVLNRPTVDEKEVEKRVTEFEHNGDPAHAIYSKANKVPSPAYTNGGSSSQGKRTPNAYETPTIVSASQVHASMSGGYNNAIAGNSGFQRPQVGAPGPGASYHIPGASFVPGVQGPYGQPFAYSQFPPSQLPLAPPGPIPPANSARHVQHSNLDDAVRGSGFAPSPQQGSSAQFIKTTKTGMYSTTSEWKYDQNKPPSGSSGQRLSAPGTQTTITGDQKNSDINYGMSPQAGPMAPRTGSLPPNASYQAIPNGVSNLPISKNTVPRTEAYFTSSKDIPPVQASASGVKRRLGMGTRATGYTNTKFKKFKPSI
ncbi:hypothetical protein CVT24_000748 [Panaeolus cyanescens]|uniref:DNA 3'-5' helicase n=1 Tax=Panaeolus cyanescens TaxID=181874 RepID=A0A409YCP8_9AGAR|nr:hypothetical protein CVT24_000748 [Panaeolus cyanescens]